MTNGIGSLFSFASDGSGWNQALFAAPMIVLYLLGIAIAWAVAPRAEP